VARSRLTAEAPSDRPYRIAIDDYSPFAEDFLEAAVESRGRQCGALRTSGADPFDRRAKPTDTRRLVRRLKDMGYAVQITPLAA
jgi:hypothetical protein